MLIVTVLLARVFRMEHLAVQNGTGGSYLTSKHFTIPKNVPCICSAKLVALTGFEPVLPP